MRICPQCQARTASRVCPEDGFQTVEERAVHGAVDWRVGKVFQGRYRIDAVLGRGGMGTVYRATQLTVGRPVAIKALNADVVDDLTTMARFEQEARSVAALRHPNTIRLIDFGRGEDGALFLVMEYLEGEPLSVLMRREAPLPVERVIRIACQILESLAEAHSVGIVHRDMKPDNVFVTDLFGRQDFIKLLDFGIAKVSGFGPDSKLTGTGVALGTPRYIAPEQACAESVDARADLYALGAVLYEMLTGQLPYQCNSVAEYLLAHVERDVPQLQLDGRTLHGALPDLIRSCLSKEPSQRPSSAVEMLERLQSCAEQPYDVASVTTEADDDGGATLTITAGVRVGPRGEQGDVHDVVPTHAAVNLSAVLAGAAGGWPGTPSKAAPTGSAPVAKPLRPKALRPRGAHTGIAPRGYRAVPPPPAAPRSPMGLQLALAAVALFALGGGVAWFSTQRDASPEVTSPTSASAHRLPVVPASSPPIERVVERSVPAPPEVDPGGEEAREASLTDESVVTLVTVPEGATVKLGQMFLGKTPVALIWEGQRDERPLKITLAGYETERLRRSDVGESAWYELHLRPEGAAPKRAPARRSSSVKDGSWVTKISKRPARRKPDGVEPEPTPPAKKQVYEELD